MTESATCRDTLHQRLRDVGVERFNASHAHLLDLIIKAHAMVEEIFRRKPTAGDWQGMEQILSDLAEYTRTHFREEEELMAQHGYPDHNAHREQHRALSEQIRHFQEQCRQQRTILFSSDLRIMLLDWLFSHINLHDVNYKAFFNAKGVH
ncbi:MAG: bacteriohemerythrin [Magnetococcales bacterium]|nr:bacteriohemerythrin [Magnetococcales bacterium]